MSNVLVFNVTSYANRACALHPKTTTYFAYSLFDVHSQVLRTALKTNPQAKFDDLGHGWVTCGKPANSENDYHMYKVEEVKIVITPECRDRVKSWNLFSTD